jgi:hypothetical protein
MTSGYSGFINDIKVEPNPCGTIEGATTYHHDFKKTEKKYMDLHHKNHFRTTDGIPPEYSRLFKQHHTDVTNNLNNLINFNPTIGLTQFEEHDTNKMLHGGIGSRPRFESVNNRNTEIVDKIQDIKKPRNHFHTRPEHSQTLRVRRL